MLRAQLRILTQSGEPPEEQDGGGPRGQDLGRWGVGRTLRALVSSRGSLVCSKGWRLSSREWHARGWISWLQQHPASCCPSPRPL